MQFLQMGVHSKVPHTIEQQAKIHGTSSSGGIEHEHTKHIKCSCCLQMTSGILNVSASHKQTPVFKSYFVRIQ